MLSVTFFVKRDNFELAFWLLCSMHTVMQVPSVEWWAAVTVVAIPLQPALIRKIHSLYSSFLI